MINKKQVKFKICLLGNPGVGKTSLIQKYVYDFFGDVYIRTMGTKVTRKVIKIESEDVDNNYEVSLMIWDIMGQKIQSVLHKNYFKFSKGALIACDVTRKNTILDCEDWVNNLYEVTEKIPVVFLANKVDLKDKICITDEELMDLAKKYDAPFYFTSAKTGENVNQAFYHLGRLMLDIAIRDTPLKKIETREMEPLQLKHSGSDIPEAPEIKPGGCYLIKEEKPVKSFKIFKQLLIDGNEGLCLTRTHPNMVRNHYDPGAVPIHWFTTGEQEDNTINPTQLSRISDIINDFIQQNPKSAIILEGVEFLIEQNNFKTVLNMIHTINDSIVRSNAIFLLPLDPFILEEKELHLIGRELLPID